MMRFRYNLVSTSNVRAFVEAGFASGTMYNYHILYNNSDVVVEVELTRVEAQEFIHEVEKQNG